MSVYLDTSVLISALTLEPGTQGTQAWLAAQREGSLAISEWVTAEFASALALQRRSAMIGPEAKMAAQSAFAQLKMQSFQLLDIQAADFQTAAQLVGQPGMALRAPDALHIAIAQRYCAGLATLDRKQAAGARAAGLPVTDLNAKAVHS